jgi:septal ring factor EnvC (AmiA/AmiB activator)
MVGDHNAATFKLKKDNEQLLESLHKEQDKSYKLLRDLHQHMQDGKALKGQLEEYKAELDQLRIERHKF